MARKKRQPKKQRLTMPNKLLGEHTKDALRHYLANLNGHRPGDLYELMWHEMERSLLEVVMEHADNHQGQAAEILGIDRSTLRRKLIAYSLYEPRSYNRRQ